MKNIAFIIIFIVVSNSCNHRELIVEGNSKDLSFEKNILLYKGKEYSGMLVVRYDTEDIKEERNYKNGLLHGNQIKRYVTGVIYSNRYYSKGVKIGIHKGWWLNGNKKYEFHFNSEGQHHGVSNEWFQDGTPFKLFNYKNGKEEGSQKMFKYNGDIRANYVVVKGDRFGLIGLKKCDAVSTM